MPTCRCELDYVPFYVLAKDNDKNGQEQNAGEEPAFAGKQTTLDLVPYRFAKSANRPGKQMPRY